MSLSVFATIHSKPECFDEVKSAILGILEQTRAEIGCEAFTLHEGGEGTLHLFEIWTDEAALQAHYEQPYTREVFEAYEEWLHRPVEVLRMRPIA